MRRSDLALSREEAFELIDRSRYAVVSLVDTEGRPYGVALDYVRKDGYLYFHGAREGRKVDAMKANPWACAVILGDTSVVPDKFGRKYSSVVAEGPVELVDDIEMMRQVMNWVIEFNSPEYLEKGKRVIEKMLDRVLVYKMRLDTVSGKHGINHQSTG
jgi:nitroimidazol reductase NimA-like FMN-containing flavoprotein (pyridoxamine 5'-phosphate oxidase superfamily)